MWGVIFHCLRRFFFFLFLYLGWEKQKVLSTSETFLGLKACQKVNETQTETKLLSLRLFKVLPISLEVTDLNFTFYNDTYRNTITLTQATFFEVPF